MGELWLASNGKTYSKFWANGGGRAYSVATLSKIAGLSTYVAGAFFDWQSWDISAERAD